MALYQTLNEQDMRLAAIMWRTYRMDTAAIAAQLGASEASVANSFHRLREFRREQVELAIWRVRREEGGREMK